MKTHDFYYDLPEELIAQTPLEKRDTSRLLVMDRVTGEVKHQHFYDIIEHLIPGDCLVMNDSRVLPARLLGHRPTGGAVEVLLLRDLGDKKWECLCKPGKRAKPGTVFSFGDGRLTGTVTDITDDGGRVVRFSYDGNFYAILEEIGQMPLPPYIHEKLEDQERYQTVYSRAEGSVAAPTAGLHFTPELLNALREKGVKIASVTLHVGLGTFRPVKAEAITDHHMHAEQFHIEPEVAAEINRRRAAGGRVIAVGTTSCRTLESVGLTDGVVKPADGWTEIFIYPGYKFKAVDALITNFHLPESTLLMLVSAFYDKEKMMSNYRMAVEEEYRFFSFGDAMLIV